MAPAGELAKVSTATYLGALFLLAAGVCKACVRVEVAPLPQPSTKNAKITVRINGRPAGRVRLSVRHPGRQGRQSIQTDADGTAMLTGLPEGTTCVLALGENNLTSSLCLDVPRLTTTEKSLFYMVLGPTTSSLSPENTVDVVEQSPPSVRLKSLNGTVLDVLSAQIVTAEIQVYRRGTYPQDPVASLKTDDRGRFAALREPGIYTVVFTARGFKSEIVGVEVTPVGGEKELRETLQVASDCDW